MTNKDTADENSHSPSGSAPGALLGDTVPDKNSNIYTATIAAARTESTIPYTYRLALKPDGTLVLQGAYMWQEGWNHYGHEWRDIPTVTL